jgi:exopolysaccharide biosynthesis polyprenyl glycosylphosphotransferase
MIELPDGSARSRDEAAGQASGSRWLVVGPRRRIRHLARRLSAEQAWAGPPIVGAVGISDRGRQLVVHPASAPVPILGRIDRLREVVDRSRATDLLIAAGGRSARRVHAQLRRLGRTGAPIRVHWLEQAPPPATPADTPARAPSALPWDILWQRAAKRAIDILAAAVGLAVLTPLFLFVAAAILVSSGGPVFYSQERVGQGGRRFRIWKFRSMRVDAEEQTGPIWAEDHDRRCTRIGDWLRHTNIDELPQLWNVLVGDMSLVGPRPERPVFVDQFQAELGDYALRHAVPVGMTGWAQVHGWRGRTSLRKRLQYDLDYIGRWSLWLDLRILWMTVEHVLKGRTTWNEPKKDV